MQVITLRNLSKIDKKNVFKIVRDTKSKGTHYIIVRWIRNHFYIQYYAKTNSGNIKPLFGEERVTKEAVKNVIKKISDNYKF